MFAINRTVSTMLVDSFTKVNPIRVVQSEPNPVKIVYSTLGSEIALAQNTYRPKRKASEDIHDEMEKRQCHYDRILPLRIRKVPIQPPPIDVPVVRFPPAKKAIGKRPSLAAFKTSALQRTNLGPEAPQPERKLRIPVIERRPYIEAPSTSMVRKRALDDETETEEEVEVSAPKRVHREEDNEALYVHLRKYDHDYQPTPLASPRCRERRRSKERPGHGDALRRRASIQRGEPKPIIKYDSRYSHVKLALRACEKANTALVPSVEEMEVDSEPVSPTTCRLLAWAYPDTSGESSEVVYGLETSGVDSCCSGCFVPIPQKKERLLPPIHRRRPIAHPKGTTNRVRTVIAVFSIEEENAIQGLITYPPDNSDAMSWEPESPSSPKTTSRDAYEYFLRVSNNQPTRSPSPSSADPTSPWGPLSC